MPGVAHAADIERHVLAQPLALLARLADRTIRERAKEYEENPELVRGIISEGCEKARDVARATLEEVRTAMGLEYR